MGLEFMVASWKLMLIHPVNRIEFLMAACESLECVLGSRGGVMNGVNPLGWV